MITMRSCTLLELLESLNARKGKKDQEWRFFAYVLLLEAKALFTN